MAVIFSQASRPAPETIVEEARTAEELGFGATFISERYNLKEAGVLAGAVGAVTERTRIITAATNHNTRHVMVTAGMVRTMQSLTNGRFTLGIGRGLRHFRTPTASVTSPRHKWRTSPRYCAGSSAGN